MRAREILQRHRGIEPFGLHALEDQFDALIEHLQLDLHRAPRLRDHYQQVAHRRDQREQLGEQQRAHPHIDDLVALRGVKADRDLFAGTKRGQNGAAAALLRREHRGQHVNARHLLPLKPADNAVAHKVGERRFRHMLQLAAAAFAKMPARRLCTVRARNDDPVVAHAVARHAARHMAAVARHAIAARGNALDQRSFSHFIP